MTPKRILVFSSALTVGFCVWLAQTLSPTTDPIADGLIIGVISGVWVSSAWSLGNRESTQFGRG